jgi:hypothetical protein
MKFHFMLNRLLLTCTLLILTVSLAHSQVTLDYYLPEGESYNPEIPTPESVIGHEVGEWHVTHDKLISYMRAVADASDRITIDEHAKTYEDRPVVLLTITSPDNQQNIDQIRINQRALADPSQSGNIDVSEMPVIINMGYSVHGNEPSAANAAMVLAYHLAAGQSR